MNAVLARVASWGKAKALSPDEARLNVGVVGGWGVEKGAGEGRQDTQDRENDNGIKKEGRYFGVASGIFRSGRSLYSVRVRCI